MFKEFLSLLASNNREKLLRITASFPPLCGLCNFMEIMLFDISNIFYASY